MAKFLLLKHYRGAPAPVNDIPMDQWTPDEVGRAPGSDVSAALWPGLLIHSVTHDAELISALACLFRVYQESRSCKFARSMSVAQSAHKRPR